MAQPSRCACFRLDTRNMCGINYVQVTHVSQSPSSMSAQPLVAPKQTAGGAAYRDYLSYRLEWVSKLVREEANKIYRKRFGIDIRQLRVLRIAVEQPGRTVSEIVDI